MLARVLHHAIDSVAASSENPSDQTLADDFACLWRSKGAACDVVEFLNDHHDAPAQVILGVLLVDQAHRWQTDAPILVESYLELFPQLASHEAVQLELVCEEFGHREDRGETPRLTEYRDRFPELADALDERLGSGPSPRSFVRPSAAPEATKRLDPTCHANLSGRKTRHRQSDVRLVETCEESSAAPTGQAFGRYRVERVLGSGAFGSVYLARDEELDRLVAVKVLKVSSDVTREHAIDIALKEARTAAKLDHPHVVPVFDIGYTGEQMYVVSKLIDGQDLATRLKSGLPSHAEAARMIAALAAALQHAHTRGLVHRDVKTANVLVDTSGTPYLCDLGLALWEEDYGSGPQLAGTPLYMSPEQARGEGHLVDGRSDIYSLGVVLYELLTGKTPFQGNMLQLVTRIATEEVKPPRQHDDSIPKELERICLRCLANRAADRYTTAADLADDLRAFISGTREPSLPKARVVPKGLRSFDEHDEEFFLRLVPGPRDRNGLPNSLVFWKERLEESDPRKTFRVGLLYGPSGSGKSSLIKAGLLPRLAEHIRPLYVEATSTGTEQRLLDGLHHVCAELPKGADLREAVAWLRRGRSLRAGRKIVMVIDQFEQWLHARRDASDVRLVQAMRQCDGEHVQCLLLVRDDFWVPASEFMRELDQPIQEGRNARGAALFDALHARNVLTEFGAAYDRFPEGREHLSDEQNSFLSKVVEGLAEDGKIICVRLALLAEMMKGRDWTPRTLAEMGGAAGVGTTFLEESFTARSAPPGHRLHAKAARAVLAALLPPKGSEIRGHMQSHAQLKQASGYDARPDMFDELLEILDGELRLITPASRGLPEARQPATEANDDGRPDEMYYQLTHDYLVPALRDWLTLKQRETARGRAAMRLADRTHQWLARRESRHLPLLWEYLSIVLLTSPRTWSASQRVMMRQATLLHGLRWGAALLLAAFIAGAGLHYLGRSRAERRQLQQQNEQAQNQTRASMLIDSLMKVDNAAVVEIIHDLQRYRPWAQPLLNRHHQQADHFSVSKLRAALALLPGDVGVLDYLIEHLLQAPAADVPLIVGQLLEDGAHVADDDVLERLWAEASAPGGAPAGRRLRAAAALAALDSDNGRWFDIRDLLSRELVQVPSAELAYWQRTLRPVGGLLAAPLLDVIRDPTLRASEREVAIDLLVVYAARMPEMLARAIQLTDQPQFDRVFAAMQRNPDLAGAELVSVLAAEPQGRWQDAGREPQWPDPAQELVTKFERAYGLVAPRFAFCQTLPLADFEDVCRDLEPCGYRPASIRPFQADELLQIAAVWTRDGQSWEWHVGDAASIEARDAELRSMRFTPADIVACPDETSKSDVAPTGEAKFAALWVCQDETIERRLLVGLSRREFESALSELAEIGFGRLARYSITPAAEGNVLCSAIAAPGDVDQARLDQPGFQYSEDAHAGLVQQDLHYFMNAPAADPQLRWRRYLEQANKLLSERPDDLSARYSRALGSFYLGLHDEAASDLEWLLEREPQPILLRFLTLIEIQRDDREAARAYLDRFAELSSDVGQMAYLQMLFQTQFGAVGEGADELERDLQGHHEDGDFLVWGARAYGRAAHLVADQRQSDYRQRSVELIQQALRHGFADYELLSNDPDLAAIRSRPEIAVLGYYSACWRSEPGFESRQLRALGPAEHQIIARRLVEQGFRPISAASVSVPGTMPRVASLWQRPIPSEEEKQSLAERQSRAAAALLRLGRAEEVWPFLTHRPDPRGRSQLIHRLQLLAAPAEPFVRKLSDDRADRSLRRALLLALGEFSTSQLPLEQRQSIVPEILRIYREDADPGMHAAAHWLLTRWGHMGALSEVQSSLAPNVMHVDEDSSDGGRGWYLTRERHTMVVVQGGSFMMGSDYGDDYRAFNEALHRQRIDRTFALSAAPVTREQYERFQIDTGAVDLANLDDVRAVARTADSPMTGMTWYEAAAYCNWLSQREGIAEEEWCYEPNSDGEYASGMRPREDYLSRGGYRLPSEAEWEFACRAGAVTRRYYGHGDELLEHYAWYVLNSQQRTQPAGWKKPNDFGLFDMHGNVWSWCHNRSETYGPGERPTDQLDVPDVAEVNNEAKRVVRGGGFYDSQQAIRAADRLLPFPMERDGGYGMRVARTIESK